ncbi:hypothetical protein TI39_contig49g00005 [Zymoseptoria brevis]|uniref:Uncharacterized protein n=1 Tax=Zymoseptoria brevis TaxID=1047168 RepID=A0A0F4GYI4_9PEZI|nr:hypothetical protein TI39_contig49g00005 [Zymoseptoria brevis]
MYSDEESSFNELGALMKRVRAVESIARHHEDAVRFHKKAGRNAELQAEKARTEARALRELYKESIKKFATAFSVEPPVSDLSMEESIQERNREKRATIESHLDWPFSEGVLSSAKVQAIAATDAVFGVREKAWDTNELLPTSLHISHTNAAFTLAGNTSSEYTSISSSFVQRVAKRKESISALQKMNPTHLRTASEPTRKVSPKPVQMEETTEEESLGSEHDHIKAFL